jgi:DtxR family Mn-dependent transcriptional regulator
MTPKRRNRETGDAAAAGDAGRPSAPAEDCLKAIYEIESSGNAAGTNEIARHLQVAAPSVTGMVRRLAEKGLVAHEPYRGATLTEAGRRAALQTLRRHRVIETYLAIALGYPWDRVHDEAERLEHAASDELVDRMATAVGDPGVDPHGAPIPRRDGTIDETRHRSLAELPVGEPARMTRVSDEDPALLQYLARLGLKPGAEVVVEHRAPFDGPTSLRVDGASHLIGSSLATQIRIAPLATAGQSRGASSSGAARNAGERGRGRRSAE